MATTNNEIYRLLTEFNGRLGELTGTLKALDDKVDEIREDMSDAETTSAHYRAGVRDELAKLVLRQTHQEADLLSIRTKVEGMEKVTNEVATLRTKAQGAGIFGMGLLRLGGWVLGAAGWIYGAYLWVMGRPPP